MPKTKTEVQETVPTMLTEPVQKEVNNMAQQDEHQKAQVFKELKDGIQPQKPGLFAPELSEAEKKENDLAVLMKNNVQAQEILLRTLPYTTTHNFNEQLKDLGDDGKEIAKLAVIESLNHIYTTLDRLRLLNELIVRTHIKMAVDMGVEVSEEDQKPSSVTQVLTTLAENIASIARR